MSEGAIEMLISERFPISYEWAIEVMLGKKVTEKSFFLATRQSPSKGPFRWTLGLHNISRIFSIPFYLTLKCKSSNILLPSDSIKETAGILRGSTEKWALTNSILRHTVRIYMFFPIIKLPKKCKTWGQYYSPFLRSWDTYGLVSMFLSTINQFPTQEPIN